MANARSTRGWKRLRRAVLARDGGRCQIQAPGCVGAATHVDHVEPRKWGGDDSMANLRAACAPCNQHRSTGLGRPPDPPASVW